MIRNILFDYGGVLIDLDYDKPRREFENLGITGFAEHFTQLSQGPIFDDFDKGCITELEFRRQLRERLNVNLSDEQIDSAWNSMIIGIQEEKIQFLSELYAENYQCYLLSNTNFIHLKYITKYLLKTYGRFNLDAYFNKVYYSCTMGMRKPDPGIFKKVISDNDLVPGETLYVDDSPQHLESAKTLGIHTLLYEPGQDLKSAIMNFISPPAASPGQEMTPAKVTG